MMAAVFFMQPLGQLFAYGVGWAVLAGLNHHYDFTVPVDDPDQSKVETAKMGIDILLRIVVGVGSVPALIAIVFRFLLPEPGRWTYGVKNNAKRAEDDTDKGLRSLRDDIKRLMPIGFRRRHARPVQDAEAQHAMELDRLNDSQGATGVAQGPNRTEGVPDSPGITPAGPSEAGATAPTSADADTYSLPDSIAQVDFGQPSLNPKENHPILRQFNSNEIFEYLWDGGNWRRLAGTSLCWFLLDFA
jgi:hypothetical protein